MWKARERKKRERQRNREILRETEGEREREREREWDRFVCMDLRGSIVVIFKVEERPGCI